jgi:hypothetical protein
MVTNAKPNLRLQFVIDLRFLCQRTGICHDQIVEVGVGRPGFSHVLPLLREQSFKSATLVEAVPCRAEWLQRTFRRDPRIRVVCAAVCDVNERVELYEKGGATFLAQLATSPAIASGFFPTLKSRLSRLTWKERSGISSNTFAAAQN